MNGYPRGYPSGRGYNRGGGGGPGPASPHSPSSGGGGQRVPYDNITSPSLPPLPLHFSQTLPHPNQQQQHGMDPMYHSPPPRHISRVGPPGLFDPYQLISSSSPTTIAVIFALHLIQGLLIGVFRSTNDIKYQSHLAYRIQELLKFCQFVLFNTMFIPVTQVRFLISFLFKNWCLHVNVGRFRAS
jgi:hypothetical protein